MGYVKAEESYSPYPTHTLLGFPFAFGVFQEYYSTHPPFEGSGNIAVIGTCAMVSTLQSLY